MRVLTGTLAMVFAVILSSGALLAQETTPPTPPTTPPPADEPPPPSILSQAAGSSYDRPDALPNVNIYLPEGRASLRLRKLIRNVLFETQLEYEFINGDISAYLRYKYYARTLTYRISVFDSIEFPDPLTDDSSVEFERVRGALALFGFPRDNNHRYFWLLQGDSLSFGDLKNVDNKKKNFYTKIGYQFGTRFDERLNAIVGETRGRETPVLTAFRDIGEQKTGFAIALTQTPNVSGGEYDPELDRNEYNAGDYRYTKLEAEGLRRFDVSSTSFIFTRLHLGAFAGYDKIPYQAPRKEFELYSIPRYELFRLGGREALKAVDTDAVSTGTHEAHLTNEFFTPIFRNRDYKMGVVHWNTLYGSLYLGAGGAAFRASEVAKRDRFVVDAGIGAETSLTVRDLEVLLSIVFANTIKAPDALKGNNILFSIRTIR